MIHLNKRNIYIVVVDKVQISRIDILNGSYCRICTFTTFHLHGTGVHVACVSSGVRPLVSAPESDCASIVPAVCRWAP